MCYSATVSFAVGGVLLLTGAASLNKTTSKSERLYASFPLVFGLQQVIEGFVWIYLNQSVCNIVFSSVFLFFAHAWWPVVAPLSVYLLESSPKRKILLKFLTIINFFFVFLYFLHLTGPIFPTYLDNQHLNYWINYDFMVTISLLYLVSICTAFLVSSYHKVKVYGLLLFISSVLSFFIYTNSYVSNWCFFGAVLSFYIYFPLPIKNEKRSLKQRETAV